MSKYSYDFKKQVVSEYLDGQGGTLYLAKLHGIPNHSQIQRWVAAYKKYGDNGLMRSRQHKTYSFEQKLHMVELYLSSELSYQELALQEGVHNPTLITKWVNDFRIAGPDALRAKKKGRKKNERFARIISSLRGQFRLKDLLSYTGMPKATYMYWQKRFERENPNKELEDKILEIHNENKDFGYRRMHGLLRKQGYAVNKKRVQRIMQKLGLQVTSFTRKSRKYSSYKGKVGKVAPNRIHKRFHIHIPHQKITTDTTEFKYYEVDEKGKMVIKNFIWIHLWICVMVKY